MHKSQIRKLVGYITQKGYTLVPLTVHFSRGKVKIDLAVARGKQLHDKRNTIAKKDAERRMQRASREYR